MKHIVFCKHWCFGRELKQAWALKHEFPDIKLTLLCSDHILHSRNLFKEVYDDIYEECYHDLGEMIKVVKPDLFHVYDDASPVVPYTVMQNTDIPVIFDAQDIQGIYRGVVGDKEKYCWENTAGFVLRHDPIIFDFFKERGYNIKAPYLEYLDYALPPLCRTSSHPSDSIHLCYTGVVDEMSKGERGWHNQWIRWIPRVLDQGFHFHFYPSGWMSVPQEYIELDAERDNFHLHQGLNWPQTQKEISNYHYGAILPDFSRSEQIAEYSNFSHSHKVSTMVEAGLPIILGTDMRWLYHTTIERYGLGFGLPFGELDNLAKIEKEVDYGALKKHILKMRENEYNAFVQVHRLMDFYKEILS